MFGMSLILGGSSDIIKSIPNLFGYWTADYATLSGSTITALPDQSGNRQSARDLVSVALDPAYTAMDSNFNNKPSISATSAAHKRLSATLDTSISQAYTFYLVMRVESLGAGEIVYWRSNAGSFTNSAGLYMSNDLILHTLTLDAASSLTATTAATSGTNYVNCCIYNGSSSAIYMNDSQNTFAVSPTDGSVDGNSCAVITIGTFAGSAADYSWTTMAVYTGAHDAVTRQKVMNYLGKKYGITTT